MDRKEYKLLVEGWKDYLNEISVDITGINKIKKMSESLYQLRHITRRDIKIDVSKMGKDIVVKILNLDKTKNSNNVYFQKVIDHDIQLTAGDVNVKDENGDSRDAWQIMWSEATGGYGPLLYEIGIEVISCFLNGAIMSDRKSVSEDAYKVWQRYQKRAESEFNLTLVKMDVNDQSLEDYYDYTSYDYGEIGGVIIDDPRRIQKMTPKDPTDDMYQFSTLDRMKRRGEMIPRKWEDVKSPLSFAFYKKSPEVIEFIKDIQKSEFELDLDFLNDDESSVSTDLININLQG